MRMTEVLHCSQVLYISLWRSMLEKRLTRGTNQTIFPFLKALKKINLNWRFLNSAPSFMHLPWLQPTCFHKQESKFLTFESGKKRCWPWLLRWPGLEDINGHRWHLQSTWGILNAFSFFKLPITHLYQYLCFSMGFQDKSRSRLLWFHFMQSTC